MGEPKPKQLSVKMTERLYEDLRALAGAERRKMVDLVTIVLEDYIKTKGTIVHLPPEEPKKPKKLI